MNKNELIKAVAESTGVSKKDTAAVLEAVLSNIGDTMAKGENVQLMGFGTFEVRDRAAREGKNPRTGEPVQIDACKVPAFKAGKALKEKVK